MRIDKIKIAGFKSFVDPTTLALPGRLTGVVGPNGCGKSNVVDAVLWVMGESSAKHLRGDSMSDVIFNGSSSRKPVGQAQVELIFDNSDGHIGGQYAAYTEISIKRCLERDGTSVYSLNGARCRRRDITDLFLGTGLGARSYSVIEQGMISRIVEAKPEDIRAFIEEAAGISKYKERRRETENRIRNTQDNLNRLNDLREELEKQLNKLQRQARAAERFQGLEQQKERLELELTALRWQALKQELDAKDRIAVQRETTVEGAVASLREVESQIEKDRLAQHSALEDVDEIQTRYYAVGAEASRVEQSIQHHKERVQDLQRDLDKTLQDHSEARANMANDEQELQQIVENTRGIEPEHERAVERERAARQALAEVEQAMQVWQSEWDAYNQLASDAARKEQVEQTRVEHLEQGIGHTRDRISELLADQEKISSEQRIENFAAQQESLARAEAESERLTATRETTHTAIQHAREVSQNLSGELDEERVRQQTLQGRLASLEALQQSAMGKDQASVLDWLSDNQLGDAPRLAEALEVEPGWERALEVVLSAQLEALGIAGLDAFAGSLSSLGEGSVCAIDTTYRAHGPSSTPAPLAALLKDKIRCRWPVDHLLDGVYAVGSLQEAIRLAERLGLHESVVTSAGEHIGPGWIRINRGQSEEAGILAREREIGLVRTELDKLQEKASGSTANLAREREELQALEMDYDKVQQQIERAQQTLASVRSELAAKQERLRESQRRLQEIEAELEKAKAREAKDSHSLRQAKDRLIQLRATSDELAPQRSDFERHRESSQESLHEAREAWQAARDHSHEVALKTEALRARRDALEQALGRGGTQIGQLDSRCGELRAALNDNNKPIEALTDQLEQILQQRVDVETELREARQGLHEIEERLKFGHAKRSQQEQALEGLRNELEHARLEVQTVRVRLEDLQEQLRESGEQPADQLLNELPDEAEISLWQERVEAVARKIQRLGPINLAAISECKELSERKEYIDQQHGDLTEALSTLTEAIRKIDRETRMRFKDTFDKVDQELQSLFPILFGGGKAQLQMTGEDLLDTGVTLMAHPPGKRNSTIHLLSGGEKSLTALALVFALFKLNPAPFCLLDEVDAPLDDSNVGRFCDLLRSMTDNVQFIFVTHNKITMEIASQLIGVTMHEAGVSRLVAVDIDKAVKMAAVG